MNSEKQPSYLQENESGIPYTPEGIQKLAVFMRQMNNVKTEVKDVLINKETIVPRRKKGEKAIINNPKFIELVEQWKTKKGEAIDTTPPHTQKAEKLKSQKEAATKFLGTVATRKSLNAIKKFKTDGTLEKRRNKKSALKEINEIIKTYRPSKYDRDSFIAKTSKKIWNTISGKPSAEQTWESLAPGFEKLKTLGLELNNLNKTFEKLPTNQKTCSVSSIDSINTSYREFLNGLKNKNTDRLENFPATLLQQIKQTQKDIQKTSSKISEKKDDGIRGKTKEERAKLITKEKQKIRDDIEQKDRQFKALTPPHEIPNSIQGNTTIEKLERDVLLKKYADFHNKTRKLFDDVRQFETLPNQNLFLVESYKKTLNEKFTNIEESIKSMEEIYSKIPSKKTLLKVA